MKAARMTDSYKRGTALALVVLVSGLCGVCAGPAQAGTTLNGSATKTTGSTSATKKFFDAHPKVKKATVGAGVGAGVGAVTGLITRKGVLRGGAVGAGTGAGVGLLQSSKTMKDHPIVKDVAQGTLIGTGLGMAAHKGHGTTKKTVQSAAAGAAVGLGIGLLKELK